MTDKRVFLQKLLQEAKHFGATDADALMVSSTAVSVQVRNAHPEKLERSETNIIGLRVFKDKRSATISTTDFDKKNITRLVEKANSMAKILPEDPYTGLPYPSAKPIVSPEQLDLYDPTEHPTSTMLEWAKEAESAALSVKGVSNSVGGSYAFCKKEITLANSKDFFGSYTHTNHSISACVLAGSGVDMQRDYDYHSAIYFEDLENPSEIGKNAGERAVAKLNPTKPKTGVFPVIFHPRVARSLIEHLANGVNGSSVTKGSSFLQDSMGKVIFPPSITVIDQPYKARGLGSIPFDSEGLFPETINLIKQGKLVNWLLDFRSAKQLGLNSNGHASRGVSSAPFPSPTNLYVMPSTHTPEELMQDIKEGIYVTELIGSSVNMLTGDYSRGASGFKIRNGTIAEPIVEFTLASNLIDMFSKLHVANDLEFRYHVNSPTIRIDDMSIAGD